jgi:hypothetical protein
MRARAQVLNGHLDTLLLASLESGQAPTRPLRPHQRIRAGRIEAKVKTGGRVLEQVA